MFLGEYTQHANNAERTRRRIRYRGATAKGDALWTPEEDEVCMKYGTDYKILVRKLPHRSYHALRARCQKLGLRPKRSLATASELSKLRRLAPTANAAALREAFPSRTLQQVKYLCRYYGIRRTPQRFKSTGYPILDAIRARCFELRYSMVDLDAIAKTKSYFQKANWHANGLNYNAVCKAIDALDGELAVRWRDQ